MRHALSTETKSRPSASAPWVSSRPLSLRSCSQPAPTAPHRGLLIPTPFTPPGLSEFYGPGSDQGKQDTIQTAIGSGCTFIDTADMYGSGANEELLAPFVQKNRDKVFICTKFGIVRGPGGSFEGTRGDKEYVRESCEGSLKRLGVESIDLYCES